MNAPEQEGKLTEEAVAQLRAGALTPEAAFDVAVWLRQGKGDDPVQGVLAAYLYDAQADIESVWRTGYFLHCSGISIPYDIAMLGRLRCRREPERGVLTTIPATQGRASRSQAEVGREWVYSATAKVDEARVAGSFPWLRQGWALLDRGSDDPVLVGDGLEAIGPFVLAHPFTTLSPEGGQLLRTYLRSI